MKNLEKVLQSQYEQELKMMKEMAFFLEQEEFLHKVDTDKKFSLFVDTGHYDGNLVFRIETNKTQTKYILHAMFYSEGKTESVDKIERKLPQTIMKHINRIIKDLPEIFEAREEYEDYIFRKRTENIEDIENKAIEHYKREQKEQDAIAKSLTYTVLLDAERGIQLNYDELQEYLKTHKDAVYF